MPVAETSPADEVSSAEAAGDGERLGRPGRPLNRQTPFFIGLTGALGVAVAYLLARAIIDAGEVITLVAVALFLAVGLDPAVVWLERWMPRWLAVVVVLATVTLAIAAFAAAAALPIGREMHQLSTSVPGYKKDINSGKGWIGHLAKDLHVNTKLTSGKVTRLISPSTVVGGVVGAGEVILSAATAVVAVVVLTIYFLVALPAVRQFWIQLMPRSRRARATALTDEVASRVGGFVLGNLLTSIVAGVGTTLWLAAFGVPYPLLLGMLVALLDLIPIVGSTIGGVIASLVALTQGLPIAVATLGFYVFYRLFEDYLLTPRVMRHTVRISPGLTIIATLVGGVLLGLIGALIAIPMAAAIRLILDEVTLPSLERR